MISRDAKGRRAIRKQHFFFVWMGFCCTANIGLTFLAIYRAGCGVNGGKGSFGTGFNNGGGGIYALLLDTTGIRVWFLPRNKITSDITSGKPNPSLWGTPQADFRSSSSCNVGKTFKDLTIVRTLWKFDQ